MICCTGCCWMKCTTCKTCLQHSMSTQTLRNYNTHFKTLILPLIKWRMYPCLCVCVCVCVCVCARACTCRVQCTTSGNLKSTVNVWQPQFLTRPSLFSVSRNITGRNTRTHAHAQTHTQADTHTHPVSAVRLKQVKTCLSEDRGSYLLIHYHLLCV